MNREKLSDWDIDLISMLGYTVRLYNKDGQVLAVGRLHTHKDTLTDDNLKYFSITPDEGDQWVFDYNEIAVANSDSYYMQLNL